jgi:hypothetical protein
MVYPGLNVDFYFWVNHPFGYAVPGFDVYTMPGLVEFVTDLPHTVMHVSVPTKMIDRARGFGKAFTFFMAFFDMVD